MQALKTLGFAIAVAGGLTIGGAEAAPLPLAAPAASTDLLVKVHGCHDSWRRGHYERRGPDGWGWHRHVGRNCRAIAGRSYDRRRDRDYRHRRNCFHIGPVTVCE